MTDFELDANLNGSTLETAGAKARKAAQQPSEASTAPEETPAQALRAARRTKALTAALKVIEEWQRYRDYLTTSGVAIKGMTEQAYLFYATLDIHAEILTEALKGHTDPELALKLATLITHPKEEFEKGADRG